MPLVYATPTDWTDGTAPANAERLLHLASVLVRGATRTAVYATTTTGLPAAGPVADAFRDATLTQAAWWARHGIDPDQPVIAGKRVTQSKSIGSGSITYADSAQLLTARQADTSTLRPEAAQILTDAGLTDRPWVIG